MSTRFRIDARKLFQLSVHDHALMDHWEWRQLQIDAAYFLSQETIRVICMSHSHKEVFIEAFQTYHADWEMDQTVAGLVWDYLQG